MTLQFISCIVKANISNNHINIIFNNTHLEIGNKKHGNK